MKVRILNLTEAGTIQPTTGIPESDVLSDNGNRPPQRHLIHPGDVFAFPSPKKDDDLESLKQDYAREREPGSLAALWHRIVTMPSPEPAIPVKAGKLVDTSGAPTYLVEYESFWAVSRVPLSQIELDAREAEAQSFVQDGKQRAVKEAVGGDDTAQINDMRIIAPFVFGVIGMLIIALIVVQEYL